MASSEEIVDIRRLLVQEFDVHQDGALGLIGSGHVSVDGRVIGMGDLRWRREDLAGRMVKAGQRQRRVFGSRADDCRPVEEVGTLIDLTRPDVPVSADDQMELGL